jgi:hypothetical protein
MNELRKTERLPQTYLEGVPAPEGGSASATGLAAALTAMREARRHATKPRAATWRAIMMSRTGKRAGAASGAAMVLFAIFHTSPSRHGHWRTRSSP